MVISNLLPYSICFQLEAFSHSLIIISGIGGPVNGEPSQKGVDGE
jgi:hypothetical protein